MRHLNIYIFLLASFMIGMFVPAMAQDDKEPIIHFNGLGRVNLQNTNLKGEVTKTDTVSPRRVTEGEFLLDLALNMTPNEKNRDPVYPASSQ